MENIYSKIKKIAGKMNVGINPKLVKKSLNSFTDALRFEKYIENNTKKLRRI